jgi:hypothetical protein
MLGIIQPGLTCHGTPRRGGRMPVWTKLVVAAMTMTACTALQPDIEDGTPDESTTSSALHAGSAPIAFSAQESDTTYYFKADTVFIGDPQGFDWYLVYQTGGELFLGSTAGDDAHKAFNFAKTYLSAGEYWIKVVEWTKDSYGRLYSLIDTSDGLLLPLLASTPDVGVIPNGLCPPFAQTVHMFMDNEDYRTISSVSGWVGGTYLDGNRNTNFVFCRVSGYNFASLASSSSSSSNYAVLRLGASCPPGSVKFSRTFDNEDYRNANSWSGNIAPNTTLDDTKMNFCLFKGDGPVAARLPALGFSYGVFAAPSFLWASLHGTIFTDDEDGGHNGYDVDSAWQVAAQQIILPGGNTTLYTARAIECNDHICSYGENAANCYADCDTCLNGVCRANENVYNCWQDCARCGDGVCSPNETAESCDFDCGDPCTSGTPCP